MSFFMVVFKVIPYIVPFLKEMIIGKKTWRQAFKENRGKTMLGFVLVISLVFNVVLTAKVGNLAFKYLHLSRAKEELEQRVKTQTNNTDHIEGSTRHPIVNNTEIAAEVQKKPKPTLAKEGVTVKPAKVLDDEVRADLERMRQREASSER